MSQDQRDDLHWLKRVEAGRMTQREAAEKMGVTARWVRKLVKRMKQEGDAVVVHGLRGRASNRKLSDKTQRQALTILKKPDWHDFGPTFAAEQLAKRHQIHVIGVENSFRSVRGICFSNSSGGTSPFYIDCDV